ncbi:unnamed protein product [Merluccius merluccius]
MKLADAVGIFNTEGFAMDLDVASEVPRTPPLLLWQDHAASPTSFKCRGVLPSHCHHLPAWEQQHQGNQPPPRGALRKQRRLALTWCSLEPAQCMSPTHRRHPVLGRPHVLQQSPPR